MLTSGQIEAVGKRFKFFDAERCAPLFHSDQPEDGMFTARGQGKFPGILMTSDTQWFLVKDQRPIRTVKDVQIPIKSKAPRGTHPFLVDGSGKSEVLAVEGEGHAVALRSIGFEGVICGGGVNNFCAKGPAAAEDRRKSYTGKSVRFLLDPDPAGRAATVAAARMALECGATRVAIVEALPTEGQDVEDWLADFETPDAALAGLFQLISTSTWETDESLDKRDEEEKEDQLKFVQSARIYQQDDDEPTLVMMVYDELERTAKLAVYGPLEDVEPVMVKYGDIEISKAARGWRVLESWFYAGVKYLPDVGGATRQYLEDRTLVLPPSPPTEPMSSAQLWAEVRSFIRTWLAVCPEMYDVLVSYIFMSYRLEDAGFQYVPYLRFYGPPGTGKGRGLEIMSALCSRSFVSQPTVSNIHRVVEYFGYITMVFDEFHLDRGMSRESMHKLIETLCLGYKRGMGLIRVVDGPGGRKIIQQFPLFGCKVFAGYGHDEDEGLARRTVNIQMGELMVPESMDLMALPPRFYQDAAKLRGELLAFRGRHLSSGMPDPEGDRARELRKAGGTFVGQVFFPLVSMVPEGLDAELRNLMDCAASRREDAQKTRETSEESYLLDAVAQLIDDGRAHTLKDGSLFITTELLHEQALERTGLPKNTVAKRLHSMGVAHSRRRVPSLATGVRAPRGGFAIRADDDRIRALMERYGIQWPREPKDKESAL